MSEQEIPADLIDAAKESMVAYFRDKRTPVSVKMVAGFKNEPLVDAIARALLAERQKATEAERERCAKIADSWEATCRNLADHYPAGHDTRIQNILCADAIADVASCIRDDAAHSNPHQACPPPAPEAAGQSVPPLGDGPADQSEAAREELVAQAQQLGMGYE